MWFEYDFTYGNLRYGINKDGETVAVVRCEGDSVSKIEIPDSVVYNDNTYKVVRIGWSAFSGCSGLTSVEIPESVTKIGRHAFSGCSGLTSVKIPASVTEIGSSAFRNCSGLTSVRIPASVKRIGRWAFSDCSGLTRIEVEPGNSVYDSRNGCNAIIETSTNTLILGCKDTIIPESVTEIEKCAFQGCGGLTSIEIPESVTGIGWYAFYGCSGLSRIEVEKGNSMYDSRNGCNAIIETSTNTLILGCKNTIIPESVTEIEECAFQGCGGLTSIEIPKSVTKIGNWAFGGCSGLTSVKIPASVAEIGWSAFSGCSGLTKIEVESGNPVYDSRNGCNAIIETSTNTLIAGCRNTIIPETVKEIGCGAFQGCGGLTSIEIPKSVTKIGYWAFEGCSGLTSVEMPETEIEISETAFEGCPFKIG